MGWFRRRTARQRLLVIGLDCASPELVFSTFRADLPHLKQLMDQGTWGVLRSSVPCITVPAWASMTSSRDPGVLGVYGFRNRAGWDYDALTTADSRAIQVPRVWDILGDASRTVLVANVPQTYPVKPVNGQLISDFLTPNTDSAFTWPALLRAELLKRTPDYRFDVDNFRTDDKALLYQRLLDMTDGQYRTLEHLLKTSPWDFAMHVNMGTDRVHHGFWRYHDAGHRLYEPNNPFQHVIRDYYRLVDDWIGRLLNTIDGETAVLVVSDHGAKRMDGAIALNEWLRLNGWLTLKQPLPAGITRFDTALVDWSRTRAWSTGGYYGRVFLNVQGREPQGIIAPDAYEDTRAELGAALRAIPDDKGQPLNTQVFRPQDIYQQVNGFPPDLLVYFGDLHWRTVGGLGYQQATTLSNDNGPDDANHAEEGLFLYYDPRARGQGSQPDRQLMDVAPTILQAMGVAVPPTMQGKPLLPR